MYPSRIEVESIGDELPRSNGLSDILHAMGGEGEAAGDVLTGGIVAGTIEHETNASGVHDEIPVRGTCLNCGAVLTNAFCAACGQPARIHRSLLSLGHDILHGVFHFEGKIWRTVPELLFRPGRLTRRYIDGERAKFVSPMALFLFLVFLMFAVFSFTGGMQFDGSDFDPTQVTQEWKAGNATAMERIEEQIEDLRGQLAATDLSDERRATIDSEIAELESAHAVMEALADGDFARITQIKEQERAEQASSSAAGEDSDRDARPVTLGDRLNDGLKQVSSNPSLLAYKLKTNAYKFSWALVPLSVPFVWLLFFWRRDIHLYDHAIFVTYSITFMMFLVMLCSLAAMAGVSAGVWGTALAFVPPIHMYKQLRGAYGLSRFGAAVRLFLLLIATTIVLTLFFVLLLFLGVLA